MIASLLGGLADQGEYPSQVKINGQEFVGIFKSHYYRLLSALRQNTSITVGRLNLE
jgi:hypothetical protein